MTEQMAIRVGMHVRVENAEYNEPAKVLEIDESASELKVDEPARRGKWVIPGERLEGYSGSIRHIVVELKHTGEKIRVPEHHLITE